MQASTESGSRTTVETHVLPEILRPNLTLGEAGGIMVLGLAILMLPIAPLGNRYSAGAVIFFLFVTLLSRNIAIITTVVLGFSLAYRFFYPGSAWHDQPWAQWYSISSLLTGHNILLSSPLVGMSMAGYLPMGDLFGGVFIALGIDSYWNVWHLVVPCLLLIPVLASPSAATVMIFMGTVSFFPYCDYTTAGGTLEISYAIVIGAVLLYRCGKITESLPLFAFAALFRQPNVMLVPFVFLVLWKDRDYYRAGFFAALLFLFGGFYILLDLKGAYQWLFRFWDVFLESFYNANDGLNSNYTISSIPHMFGIDDKVAWNIWPPAYLILVLSSVGVLLFLGNRMASRENVLFLGVLATVFVYIFSRGYAQFHYVAATAIPLAAFQFAVPRKPSKVITYWATGLAVFLVWVGAVPLAWFILARGEAAIRTFRTPPVAAVATTELIENDGSRTSIANLDGKNEHRQFYNLTQSAQFDFDPPVFLSSVRVSGDHVEVQNVKGVNLPWASETEMRGIIEDGDILYSQDGNNFIELQKIANHFSYSAYPVTIALRETPGPVRSIRIHAKKLYLNHGQWILGNVEFFGAPR